MGDDSLRRVLQRLNSIPTKVKEAAAHASSVAADDLAGDMKQFALSSKDTGALINSIEVTGPNENTPPYSQPGGAAVVPEGTYRITAGNKDVRYAHLVEFGTAKTEAQPFFWPAVRANQKQIVRTIRQAVRKTIRENWGKK